MLRYHLSDLSRYSACYFLKFFSLARIPITMKFSLVSSLITFVGLVAAAPAPVPQIPASGNVIRATTRSQYSVWTGAINYNTTTGRIFKDGRTTDITTLLTFTYPAASAGRTCTFHLYLDTASTLTGTRTFDVFSSLYPAARSTTTWPPGNGRNQQLAA